MKTTILSIFGFCCWLAFPATAQSQAESSRLPGAQPESAYAVKERGPHHKVMERIEYEETYDGKVVERRRSYQELATGMHFKNERGEFEESEAKIEILPNGAGAIASKGQHKAIFPPEIKSGLIELQTPDEQWLRSRVWGLAYFDASTGESVLLAEVKESEGQLVGDNVVVYPDAFTDFRADVRLTYFLAGFEQDIVLRENPPTPEEFGLNPQTTRLQVLTEFVEASTPTKVRREAGGLSDHTLHFGESTIGMGKAFSLDAAGQTGADIPVAKQWERLEDRDFLIEEVLYEKVTEQLQKLPAAEKYEGASLQRRGKGNSVLAGLKTLIPKRYARTAPPTDKPRRMAKASYDAGVSFVMDYVSLNSSQSNYVFKGDSTYYITGTVNLNGTTTIEGNTVIKFAHSTSAKLVSSAPVCLTDAYRPACFTSMHDNSIGESISGSSGSPTRGPGTFLEISGGGSATLQYLRFAYASNAIAHASFSGDVNPVWHSQFLKCDAAVQTTPSSGAGVVRLSNVLLSQCGRALRNTSSTYAQHLHGEQVTADYVTNLVTTAAANSSSLYLTNTILTASGGISPSQGSTNLGSSVWLSGNAGIFQTVGGGGYYLTGSSTNRDVGNTNINASLLASLSKKTTYPPVAYTNVTFTAPMTFNPQAQRDTDTPDLGYHYEPLDYSFGGCHANTNITFTAGTAVGWFRTSSGWNHAGFGIHLGDKQIGSFEGTVTAPCYWVRLPTVQENDRTAGYGPGGMEGWATAAANAPEARARFTRFSLLAGDGNHFRDDYGWLNLRAQDCEFYSGSVGGYIISMYFTNCLFERTYLAQVNGNGNCVVSLQNCTQKGSTLQFTPSYPSTYIVRDSAFDGVSFIFSGYGANASYASYAFNAFTNVSDPFPTGTKSNNLTVASFNWQSSWLGNYYLPTNSPLINTGSVSSAASVGLYHYTTQTNQTKEASSQVDIGYHYVAVDGSGVPLDSDADGLFDYWEDSNGNGAYETGDLANWNAADTDGDGVSDGVEVIQGRNPLISGAIMDTSGVINLRVHTPLK